MSHIDLDNISPRDLIAQYIVEEKKFGGLFLAYNDYQIIDNWLKAINGDADKLLLILSEELPPYFQNTTNPPRNLKGIDKKILQLAKLASQAGQ